MMKGSPPVMRTSVSSCRCSLLFGPVILAEGRSLPRYNCRLWPVPSPKPSQCSAGSGCSPRYFRKASASCAANSPKDCQTLRRRRGRRGRASTAGRVAWSCPGTRPWQVPMGLQLAPSATPDLKQLTPLLSPPSASAERCRRQ